MKRLLEVWPVVEQCKDCPQIIFNDEMNTDICKVYDHPESKWRVLGGCPKANIRAITEEYKKGIRAGSKQYKKMRKKK